MSWSDRTDVQLRSLGQHVQSNTLRAGRYILRLTNKGTTYATAVWYSTDGGSKWMELSVSVAGVGFKEVVIQNQTRRPILIDDSDIHGDTDMELTIQEIPLNAEPFLGFTPEFFSFSPTLLPTVLGDFSINFHEQIGEYADIGGLIHYSFRLKINVITHTTASGNWNLILPIAVKTNSPLGYLGTVCLSGVNYSAEYDRFLRADSGASTMQISANIDNASNEFAGVANMPLATNDYVLGTITYRAY